ncbi:uncharacterized protein [Littorina saxatilis]|uniref:Uncharacterized protein n=1 Tax=Littorina saxatilis TaxID=31220 RepID=A0AAN9B6Z5_9CAEN
MASGSDSDDDWFNKSFDEFQIPQAPSDSWGDEDDENDESEDKHAANKTADLRASGDNSQHKEKPRKNSQEGGKRPKDAANNSSGSETSSEDSDSDSDLPSRKKKVVIVGSSDDEDDDDDAASSKGKKLVKYRMMGPKIRLKTAANAHRRLKDSKRGKDTQQEQDRQDGKNGNTERPRENGQDSKTGNTERPREDGQDSKTGNTERPREDGQDSKTGNTERPQEDGQDSKTGNTERPREDGQDSKTGNAERPQEDGQDSKTGNTERPQEDGQDSKTGNTERPREDGQDSKTGNAERPQEDGQDSKIGNTERPQEGGQTNMTGNTERLQDDAPDSNTGRPQQNQNAQQPEELNRQSGKTQHPKTENTQQPGGKAPNQQQTEKRTQQPKQRKGKTLVEEAKLEAKGHADDTQEDQDDEWFLRTLKGLPTMFNLTRIHTLTTARLQSILEWLIPGVNEMEEIDNEYSDVEEYLDPNTMVCVSFLRSDTKRFQVYLKTFIKFPEKTEEDDKRVWVREALRRRSNYFASFLVVVNWLLGRTRQAEEQAMDLRLKYPLSMVARANVFYVLWKQGKRAEAVSALSLLSGIRKDFPELYKDVLCEEQAELGRAYTELGPDFIPDAIHALDSVVTKQPKWYHYKWLLALNLHRSINARHNWSHAVTDAVTPLRRAVTMLVEIMVDPEAGAGKTVAAASELGDILNSCDMNEEFATAAQPATEAGLDAAKCFDIVMEVEDAGGSLLVRAGKYYRMHGKLFKSERALKRAVAVQDSPKVNHQLGLTLKKLAAAEQRKAWESVRSNPAAARRFQMRFVQDKISWNRPGVGNISRSRRLCINSKMAELQMTMKVTSRQRFSREDKYVKETMQHFNKTLVLSHGDNSEASYDLGLMYRALGEYRDALNQFLTMADVGNPSPVYVVRAFEMAGLVKLDQCQNQDSEARARELQEEGRGLLSMAVLVQCRLAMHFRHHQPHNSPGIWRDLHALGRYLRLEQDDDGVCRDDSPTELWLLRLLRVYADIIPVLSSLQQLSPQDASNPGAIRERLLKYIRDQRYGAAVIFCNLLQLTDSGHRLCQRDLATRVHLLGARMRLLNDVAEGSVGRSFNANIARRFFLWTFEDLRHPWDQTIKVSGEKHGEGTGSLSSADDAHKENDHDASLSSSEEGDQASGALSSDHDEEDHNDFDDHQEPLNDNFSDDTSDELSDFHVQLLHDPRDPDAARAAQDLKPVLEGRYGLRTQLTEEGPSAIMRKATLEAMEHARVVLFVVGGTDVSEELESYAEAATRRFFISPPADDATTSTDPLPAVPDPLTLTAERPATSSLSLKNYLKASKEKSRSTTEDPKKPPGGTLLTEMVSGTSIKLKSAPLTLTGYLKAAKDKSKGKAVGVPTTQTSESSTNVNPDLDLLTLNSASPATSAASTKKCPIEATDKSERPVTESQKTPRASSSSRVLTLTLDSSATLPRPLRNFPSVPWSPEVALACRQETCRKAWVDAVCSFFSFLVGTGTKF